MRDLLASIRANLSVLALMVASLIASGEAFEFVCDLFGVP